MCFRFRFVCAALSFLGLGASLGLAQTASSTVADQVEEDWMVVINDPDPESTGPQITTCLSPVSGSSAFVAFCLNYRDDPEWKPGGLQIKAYGEAIGASRDRPLVASDTANTEPFQTVGETITWTQRISISSGTLSYTVHNGASTTWGSFGQEQGNLGVSYPTSLSDLGSYRSDDSVTLSAAGWQANRVKSMSLLRVRYYKGGSLISTDATLREVVLPESTP
jgi:hypothetical protein